MDFKKKINAIITIYHTPTISADIEEVRQWDKHLHILQIFGLKKLKP